MQIFKWGKGQVCGWKVYPSARLQLKEKTCSSLQSCFSFPPLFKFPASVVGIITYTDVAKTENLIVLFMLQGCIANLQGFLNCLIYGWIRGGFKSALNLYNVRGSHESFSLRNKAGKKRSSMNYHTFTVHTDEEYDTLSDPEINKSRSWRPSPAQLRRLMRCQ